MNDKTYHYFCDTCATLYRGSIEINPMTFDVVTSADEYDEFPKKYTPAQRQLACAWVYAECLEFAQDYDDFHDPNGMDAEEKKDYKLRKPLAISRFKDAFPQFRQPATIFDVCCKIVASYFENI